MHITKKYIQIFIWKIEMFAQPVTIKTKEETITTL